MAKNFVWHYENAGAVFLKSEEIANVCEKEADRMTRATGMEYKADVRLGKKRVRAMAIGNRNGAAVKKSKRFKKKG